ncbi:unnamed protein product [Prunus armeniaca]
MARYSASADERAIERCLRELHKIKLPQDNKTSGGLVVITITSPIRIGKGIEMQRGTMIEKKSMGDSTLQVANEAFQALQMRHSRAMHELRELVNREGDVRASEAELLEATNELTKDSGIYEGRAIREN